MATYTVYTFHTYQASDGTYDFDNDGLPLLSPGFGDYNGDLPTSLNNNCFDGPSFVIPAPSVLINRGQWKNRFNSRFG